MIHFTPQNFFVDQLKTDPQRRSGRRPLKIPTLPSRECCRSPGHVDPSPMQPAVEYWAHNVLARDQAGEIKVWGAVRQICPSAATSCGVSRSTFTIFSFRKGPLFLSNLCGITPILPSLWPPGRLDLLFAAARNGAARSGRAPLSEGARKCRQGARVTRDSQHDAPALHCCRWGHTSPSLACRRVSLSFEKRIANRFGNF